MSTLNTYLNKIPSGIAAPLRQLFSAMVDGSLFDTLRVSSLVGNLTGNVVGTITALKAVAAEHGPGAIGTGVAPVTKRGTLEDGTILTQIEIDLTGLGVKGDAENDVIGLVTAAPYAYIGKYVKATYGIPYRIEVLCLETPDGSATITVDIDLAYNSLGTLGYDQGAGSDKFNVGGTAVGKAYVENAITGLTANDFLYLVEGNVAATTGVYSAGQLIVRVYGHPELS